jgi:hypothetical protein
MRKIRLAVLCCALFAATHSFAQRKSFSFPFEFEKSFLAKADYDANILCDKTSNKMALVLHDNKKASYALLDANFKVQSKFEQPIGATVFNFSSDRYLGGTFGKNDVFYFVYKVIDKKIIGSSSYYQVETIDFNNKTVTNKHLFEIPDTEKLVLSFSDFGEYYTVTTSEKTSELILYNLNTDGILVKKNVPFKVPTGKSRKRNELSEYFFHTKLVKDDEEVGLETATQSSKLFSYQDRLVFVVNDGDDPTHVISINKADLSVEEKFIDHANELSTEDRGKSFVNSYLEGDRLFSLVLNKKNIRVAIYNIASNKLLKSHDLNTDVDLLGVAEPPMSDLRMGSQVKTKDVPDMKKLIKSFTRGTEGLSVTRNNAGQYVITVGTYDHVSPPSSGGSWRYPMTSATSSVTGATMQLAPVYVPGSPIVTSQLANYYTSTHFKLLLNPGTLAFARGRVPVSINEQIKDFLDGIDNKASAVKQFSIGAKQYYGSYNRDLKAWEIEGIPIRK